MLKHLLITVFIALSVGLLYTRLCPFPTELTDNLPNWFAYGLAPLLQIQKYILNGLFDSNQAFRWHNFCSEKIATSITPQNETGTVLMLNQDTGMFLRIFYPQNELCTPTDPCPGLLFFHGGGMTIGSTLVYASFTQDLATQSGSVVASVEYRKAPEYRYPIGLDDSVEAAKYFLRNSHHLGVDATRLGMAGDSAGGYLTAAVNLKLATEKLENPSQGTEIGYKLQVLIYPSVQTLRFDFPSYLENDNSLLDIKQMTRFVATHFLGNGSFAEAMSKNKHCCLAEDWPIVGHILSAVVPKDDDQLSLEERNEVEFDNSQLDMEAVAALRPKLLDVFANPLLACSPAKPAWNKALSATPPALVYTCKYDVLRDEGILYARALKQHGVEVDFKQPLCFHGLINFEHALELGKKFTTIIAKDIQRNL